MRKIKSFFKWLWKISLPVRDLKGLIILGVVWLTLSGVTFIIIGHILNIKTMYALGYTMMVMWIGPGTPLIPLVLGIAIFIRTTFFFNNYLLDEININNHTTKKLIKQQKKEELKRMIVAKRTKRYVELKNGDIIDTKVFSKLGQVTWETEYVRIKNTLYKRVVVDYLHKDGQSFDWIVLGKIKREVDDFEIRIDQLD